VIQIQNNYDREVFNGDAGYVVSVEPQAKTMVVDFPETDYQKIQDGAPLSPHTMALADPSWKRV